MTASDPALPQYEWLVVTGALAAFFFGFGTGSNDVANAFGTSVGAKTLTLRQAVIIAAIFEFTGAMVLGRVSTSVISGGIADINTFAREPEIFAYGMVCALSTSGLWQVIASYYEMNVSSTHSIIGAIIGFSLVYGGSSAVNWQTPDPASFPPYKGVVPIIVSWFFSPIFTAIAAACMFLVIRTLVLRRANSYAMSFWLLPPFVLITVFICIYFVFTKGAKKAIAQQGGDDWTDAKAAWIAACAAAGTAILTAIVLLPILRWRANSMFNEDGTLRDFEGPPTASSLKDAESQKVALDLEEAEDPNENKWKRTGKTFLKMWKKSYMTVWKILTHGTSVDIHEVVEEDELINAIHKHAEVFDPKAEYAFQYLQVFSACCVVFAHGAGEVGYMAGPLATVWWVYTEGTITKNVTAPVWVVLIGALGLVVGLATYGYNVTRAMGVRLSKLSPTRGFCAELSTAFVIMIASQYGLPTSSSQVITGGIIGVGLCEGTVGVNWKFFAKQFGMWISTLFVVSLSTAALFAQGLYAPSKPDGAAIIYYEDAISGLTQSMVNNYRASMMNYQAASAAGVIPRLPQSSLLAWNTSLTKLSASAKTATSNSAGSVDPSTLVAYLQTALSIYQTDSVLTVGQTQVFPTGQQCNSNITDEITAGLLVACPAVQLMPKAVPVTWPPAGTGVPVASKKETWQSGK